jgi:hypothetical protein
MIELTCQKYQIDDVEFFINLRYFPLLKNDFTEPFDSIFGDNVPLTNYQYSSYHPLLSVSTNDNYGDLSYPSPEDWKLITKEFYRNDCVNNYVQSDCGISKGNLEMTNDYISNKQVNSEVNWDDKKEIAYFRDDSSGCGTTSKNNIRIKLANMTSKYPELIDAKITRISERDKYDSELQFHHADCVDNKLGSSEVNYEKYKYIISIHAYGIDPKFSYYLSLGSLIFKVDCQYNSWYDHLLKPYKHYIPVKKDLSDLVALIKWAKSHDQTVLKIVKNAKIVFKKYFNQKTVLEYWHY